MSAKPIAALVAPTLRPDGSCPACSGGWSCPYHIAEGLRRDAEQSALLRRVAAAQRENEIARVCSRFELESDERGTREEKAAEILGLDLCSA